MSVEADARSAHVAESRRRVLSRETEAAERDEHEGWEQPLVARCVCGAVLDVTHGRVDDCVSCVDAGRRRL